MKSISLAGAALLVTLAACSAPEASTRNHWHMNSVFERVGYHGLGYDAERDGSYWNHLGCDICSIWTTVRTHTLGMVYDPQNPLMPPSDTPYRHYDPPPNPYEKH